MEPSSANKIFALLSATLRTLVFMMWWVDIILIYYSKLDAIDGNIDSPKWYWNSAKWERIVASLLTLLSNICCFYYLTSTLEYHMNEESLIKIVIPTQYIKFIKFLILLSIPQRIVLIICVNVYDLKEYMVYDSIIRSIRETFIVLSLLYLYMSGLSNVSHFWTSKHWKEFDTYGENEKVHEITKNITRVTVLGISGVFLLIIPDIISVIGFVLQKHLVNVIFTSCMAIITGAIQQITIVLSIYFIYPFGHISYEKLCAKCDNKMYEWCKFNHQKKSKIGAFDGNKWAPYSSIQII